MSVTLASSAPANVSNMSNLLDKFERLSDKIESLHLAHAQAIEPYVTALTRLGQMIQDAIAAAGAIQIAPTTPDVLLEHTFVLRDRIKALGEAQHTGRIPYTELLDQLENALLNTLNINKTKSMKVAAGTFFKSTKASATVDDWEAVLKFIQSNGAWDILERRVSKTAVEAIIEDTKAPVPGVKVSRVETLNVRRG